MNWLILALVSFITGFLTTLPIDTIHTEVAGRIINRRTANAYMVIFGAIVSDLIYGLIALFGIAPLFKDRFAEALLWFIGALIVLILGIFTIIYSSDHSVSFDVTPFKNSTSFLVGFTINIANPSMVVWWLFVLEFFKSLGVVSNTTFHIKALLISSALFGMILCYILFAKLTEKLGSPNFASKYEDKINKALGILLILISIYFIYKSLEFGFMLRL